MAFRTKDIRQDHWNKTHTVSSGTRRSSVCKVTRDIADIAEPQGRKFLETQIKGIPNYTRIDNTNSKGGVIIRRRVKTA